MARKEWLQLRRDRATLGMLIGVPLLQILLFGCAIELTPQTVPMVLVQSPERAPDPAAAMLQRRLAREPVFAQLRIDDSIQRARRDLADGRAIIVIDATARPVNILVDATDPVLAAQAVNVIDRFARSLGNADLAGDGAPKFNVQMLYNPEANSQAYLVPGLLGVILTMTMVMMSALSVSRERERGTFEGLAFLGIRPAELWAGKLLPYLTFGIVQAISILIVARAAFGIQIQGSVAAILAATVFFACANLALGFLFSCLAKQQMQAMQMSFFFFLPSSLLSGFMFPFLAMPQWARHLGETLPLTHFLRIVRGITLKNVDAGFILRESLPIVLFAAAASLAALFAMNRRMRS